MKKKSPNSIHFSKSNPCAVAADFKGGELSSDGGLLRLKEVERKLGLTKAVAQRLGDERQQGKVEPTVTTRLRQRVRARCAGWEDRSDGDQLRQDAVHQLAAGEAERASAPALGRFDNAQARRTARAVNEELVEQFIAAKKKAPPVLIRDFDAPDTPVHGQQEGRFFHGYYKSSACLPASTTRR